MSLVLTGAATTLQKKRSKLPWAIGGGVLVLVVLPVVLLAGAGNPPCATGTPDLPGTAGLPGGGSGPWLATAYGPPWGGINGNGTTATGLDLTAGPPAYEIAVDPTVLPLQSFARITPNPFQTSHVFYAGDTGGAIIGRHVDIYDWRGRAAQDAWGARHVNVTPSPNPGAGNLLAEITPPAATPTSASATAGAGNGLGCSGLAGTATLKLIAGEIARILPDGSAAAPANAPTAVKLALAAGNEIHTLPYPSPDVHYGPLEALWPAYDCSGSASFVLYKAGLHSDQADDSTGLESWGVPGPGRWITVFANTDHTWVVVAGIAFDTAEYGGVSIPSGSGPRWRSDPTANLTDGLSYVIRHPQGL